MKYDPKVDELNEGMRIRLGGREGVLGKSCLDPDLTQVYWNEGDSNMMSINKFPDFEIFVQPLTIPLHTKKAILEKFLERDIHQHEFLAFLESLEVIND